MENTNLNNVESHSPKCCNIIWARDYIIFVKSFVINAASTKLSTKINEGGIRFVNRILRDQIRPELLFIFTEILFKIIFKSQIAFFVCLIDLHTSRALCHLSLKNNFLLI